MNLVLISYSKSLILAVFETFLYSSLKEYNKNVSHRFSNKEGIEGGNAWHHQEMYLWVHWVFFWGSVVWSFHTFRWAQCYSTLFFLQLAGIRESLVDSRKSVLSLIEVVPSPGKQWAWKPPSEVLLPVAKISTFHIWPPESSQDLW